MTTTYAYNAKNQVSTVTRKDGSKEKYAYDCMGQVSRVDYYESGADIAVDSGYFIIYTYDNNGNVVTETVTQNGTSHVTAYAYDTLGRVIQQTQGQDAEGALQIDFAYNNADQIVSLSDTTIIN